MLIKGLGKTFEKHTRCRYCNVFFSLFSARFAARQAWLLLSWPHASRSVSNTAINVVDNDCKERDEDK